MTGGDRAQGTVQVMRLKPNQTGLMTLNKAEMCHKEARLSPFRDLQGGAKEARVQGNSTSQKLEYRLVAKLEHCVYDQYPALGCAHNP